MCNEPSARDTLCSQSDIEKKDMRTQAFQEPALLFHTCFDVVFAFHVGTYICRQQANEW